MATTLSLSRANVLEAGPDGERTYGPVSVTVRRNVAVLRAGARTVAQGDAQTVTETQTRKQWTITLVDGRTWTVDRVARPCCGG